ncbi:MAG: serine/threonine-protein kinase, partial [Cyanobacteria bacterium J06632_3]
MYKPQSIGTIIQNRYQILHVLGQGGSGITYEAADTRTQQRVALKALSLKGLSDWKKLELFDREAKVLMGLNHPAIPKYLDYFQVDTPDNRVYYIVRELAEGQSLAELVASGQRFSEAYVRQIATNILTVLQYLHSLNPPIIHRDIKPQNILQGTDGRIYLIDFGAVQAVYRETTAIGSTVVGTYGYMAPEQFRGQAVPATDLYGLGTTLLNLTTHHHPSELPQRRLKYEFRPYVSVSSDFSDWLDKLTAPLAEDRFSSAASALIALNHPSHSQAATALYIRQPAGSRVKLSRREHYFLLQIPTVGLREDIRSLLFWAVSWNSAIGVGSAVTVMAGAPIALLFLLPFWLTGLYFAVMVVNALAGRISLEITTDYFVLKRQLLFWKRVNRGKTEDLNGTDLK